MMRIFLFIAFLFLSKTSMSTLDMNEVRELFSQASTDEDANNRLYKITNSYSLQTYPLLYAYNAAAEMTLANHAYWPTTKLDYFNAGKERLEKAILKFPSTVEIRYIRFCVQQGCPFFLGYSSNLEEDKKFILENINSTDWSESYKKEVISFLKSKA